MYTCTIYTEHILRESTLAIHPAGYTTVPDGNNKKTRKNVPGACSLHQRRELCVQRLFNTAVIRTESTPVVVRNSCVFGYLQLLRCAAVLQFAALSHVAAVSCWFDIQYYVLFFLDIIYVTLRSIYQAIEYEYSVCCCYSHVLT